MGPDEDRQHDSVQLQETSLEANQAKVVEERLAANSALQGPSNGKYHRGAPSADITITANDHQHEEDLSL